LNWGSDRFASGLVSALHKAIEVGPFKPTPLQRLILANLQFQSSCKMAGG